MFPLSVLKVPIYDNNVADLSMLADALEEEGYDNESNIIKKYIIPKRIKTGVDGDFLTLWIIRYEGLNEGIYLKGYSLLYINDPYGISKFYCQRKDFNNGYYFTFVWYVDYLNFILTYFKGEL